MKYKNKRKQAFMVLFLALVLITVKIDLTSVMADESLVLTRDEFVETATNYSTVVKDLEENKNSLYDGYVKFNEGITKLESVYELLPKYRELGKKLDNGDLSPMETGKYNGYKAAFNAFGFKSHNITPQQEYATFIEPIYITSVDLRDSLAQIREGYAGAKEGVESGMKKTYYAALLLEDVMVLMEKSYESAIGDYNRNLEKFEIGLITADALKTFENNLTSAKLNRDMMARDIEDLKMQMNISRGVRPTTKFSVEVPEQLIIEVEDEAFYLEEGMTDNRSILAKEESIRILTEKVDLIREYLGKSSNEFNVVDKQLDIYKLQLQALITDKEIELVTNYNNLVKATDELEIASLELSDSYVELEKMKINNNNGLIADYIISDFNILIIQKINAKATAYRNYTEALDNLYKSAELGFPY